MPLKDHFASPLSQHRHWESFHARWAAVIADTLEGQNLHDELIGLLELGRGFLFPGAELYAAAYRPMREDERARVEVWPRRIAVGSDLPVLPLPLDRGQCLRLDLEATYREACRRMRLPLQ